MARYVAVAVSDSDVAGLNALDGACVGCGEVGRREASFLQLYHKVHSLLRYL